MCCGSSYCCAGSRTTFLDVLALRFPCSHQAFSITTCTVLQVHNSKKTPNINKNAQIVSYQSKVMSIGSKAGLQISPCQSCLQETVKGNGWTASGAFSSDCANLCFNPAVVGHSLIDSKQHRPSRTYANVIHLRISVRWALIVLMQLNRFLILCAFISLQMCFHVSIVVDLSLFTDF